MKLAQNLDCKIPRHDMDGGIVLLLGLYARSQRRNALNTIFSSDLPCGDADHARVQVARKELKVTKMRSKPLTIGERSFATQKAANHFIQELLNSQPLKTPIAEPHHSFLCALVARHPNAAEKIGAGILHFTVEPYIHGTICFFITRIDGTRTDFATLKCVRGRE